MADSNVRYLRNEIVGTIRTTTLAAAAAKALVALSSRLQASFEIEKEACKRHRTRADLITAGRGETRTTTTGKSSRQLTELAADRKLKTMPEMIPFG